MYNKNDDYELRLKLQEKGVSSQNIDFIMRQIKSSQLDENLKIMENSFYSLLEERGLWDIFEESCKELGLILMHNNEPER